MAKLEDIEPGAPNFGLEPISIATVAAVHRRGADSVQEIYRPQNGSQAEQPLNRGENSAISFSTVQRPELFDGDGVAFTDDVEMIEMVKMKYKVDITNGNRRESRFQGETWWLKAAGSETGWSP